jgi:hypothetical protein
MRIFFVDRERFFTPFTPEAPGGDSKRPPEGGFREGVGIPTPV